MKRTKEQPVKAPVICIVCKQPRQPGQWMNQVYGIGDVCDPCLDMLKKQAQARKEAVK